MYTMEANISVSNATSKETSQSPTVSRAYAKYHFIKQFKMSPDMVIFGVNTYVGMDMWRLAKNVMITTLCQEMGVVTIVQSKGILLVRILPINHLFVCTI